MSIKVRVSTTHPRAIIEDLTNFIEEEKQEIIDEIYAGVVRDNPVDTGYSQSQWVKDENGVYNDTEYVIYLEEGHSDQAPTGFINRNIKQALNRR